MVKVFFIYTMFFCFFAQLNKKCYYIINDHDIHQDFCDLISSINSLNDSKVIKMIIIDYFLMNQTHEFYNMNLSIM